MSQTSVEWLVNELIELGMGYPLNEAIEKINKAKAMEKEQIKDAANWGTLYSDSNKSAEQYYNETYGK